MSYTLARELNRVVVGALTGLRLALIWTVGNPSVRFRLCVRNCLHVPTLTLGL